MYAKNGSLVILGIFIFGCSLVGCTSDVPPTIAPSNAILTEISPTPSNALKPTATFEADMADVTPHVSPYIPVLVKDVEIRFLETDPVQVELVIRGTLPDQCKYDFYSVESRLGQNVKVSLAGIHPADRDCAQVTQDIEFTFPLGRDRPESARAFPPGDYTLTVNKYQTSFTVK